MEPGRPQLYGNGKIPHAVDRIGLQVALIFPVGEGYQGYINLKGYKEFAAENRDGVERLAYIRNLAGSAGRSTSKTPLLRK